MQDCLSRIVGLVPDRDQVRPLPAFADAGEELVTSAPGRFLGETRRVTPPHHDTVLDRRYPKPKLVTVWCHFTSLNCAMACCQSPCNRAGAGFNMIDGLLPTKHRRPSFADLY